MPKQGVCVLRAVVRTLFRALVVGLILLPAPVLALHRNLPFLLSVTPTPGTNHNPAPSRGDPHWVAFESTSDPLGTGSVGQQIFLFNSKVGAGLECQEGRVPGPALRQLTRFPAGAANPDTSGGGRIVAFDSTADLIGNGSTTRKVFVWERERGCFSDGPWSDPSGGSIRQLTDGQLDCMRPSVDVNGDVIAFECDGSGGPQVFVYDGTKTTPVITQLAAGTNPKVNASGNIVAFDSDAAVRADTPLPAAAQGFRQVYAYNRVLQRFFRLTSGAGDSINPVPAALFTGQIWPRTVFQSRADLLGNGSTGWQVFFLDPDTGRLEQLSHGFGESVEPSLGNDGGGLVSFLSTGDLLGTGTPGQHIFVFDLRLGRLFQIDADPGSVWAHARSGGGNFITFETTQDLFFTGVAGSQVYMLNTWGRIPKANIGKQTLRFVEGDAATGSRLKLRTERWHTNVAVPPGGAIVIVAGLREVRAEAPITIQPSDVLIPPIYLHLPNDTPEQPSALCIMPLGEGTGTYDCDGGPAAPRAPGGDVVITGDHNDDVCVGVCAQDRWAQTVGDYGPGGMLLSIPVRVALTRTLDGGRCPTDLTRYRWSVDTTLLLTSGTATANILNADAQAGATLSVVETGEPFQCPRMEQSNFAGAALVGVLPILRVPEVPDGTGQTAEQDVVVSLRIQPYEGKPYKPCTGPWCDSFFHCRGDADCNDNNACNGPEACAPGVNTHSNPDLCQGLPGCTDFACAPGTLVCDDQNACNGVETCDPAVGCTPGTPPVCDDGAICTEDTCDPIRGCQSTSIPMCCAAAPDCANINLCDGNETCTDGDCLPGTPILCDDHDACNGVETCDPTSGSCVLGTPPVCDDGNACTDDSCDPVLGCVHVPNAAIFCDDGNLCTTNDVCDNGLCTGTVVGCDDHDFCNGFESCNPATGTCVSGTPPVCDDGNPCTDDSCDALLGCVHTPNTNPCDDGSACTTGDVCTAGVCTGIPVPCDDGNACNGLEICDPLTGGCLAGAPPVCDDGNPCTDDACDPLRGCVGTPNTAPCDDHNLCTNGDTCSAGVCIGTPVVCDDGNLCNGIEVCDQTTGECVPGMAADCDDQDPCTLDTCDPGTGLCTHPPAPNALVCLADALTARLAATDPADVGGQKRKDRLAARLAKVRTRLADALARPKRASLDYRQARVGLAKFQIALRRGMLRQNFDVDVSNQLISMTAALMSNVVATRAAL